MKVQTSGDSGLRSHEEEEKAATPAPIDLRRELEAAIDAKPNVSAARRADAGLARYDKWSNGIRLAKTGVMLSGADCAQFKARFREAGDKLGTVACGLGAAGALDPKYVATLKAAWGECGDVLGALSTAKAGQWRGLDQIAEAGLSVATAALSQICRKVDLSALEMKRGSPLGELRSCWARGDIKRVALDPADRAFFEKTWAAIKPDLSNLQAALFPHAEAVAAARPPPESQWGSAG